MDTHLKHETYLGMLGLATLSISVYAFSRSSRRAFAQPVNWSDVALMGLAAHKITRTASHDRVTAPLRAPFTEPFEELASKANLAEEPQHDTGGGEQRRARAPASDGEHDIDKRSDGDEPHLLARTFQHSIGELLTCQYCLAPWVALSLHVVYVKRRASARALSSVFAVVAVSDLFNRLYARLERG